MPKKIRELKAILLKVGFADAILVLYANHMRSIDSFITHLLVRVF